MSTTQLEETAAALEAAQLELEQRTEAHEAMSAKAVETQDELGRLAQAIRACNEDDDARLGELASQQATLTARLTALGARIAERQAEREEAWEVLRAAQLAHDTAVYAVDLAEAVELSEEALAQAAQLGRRLGHRAGDLMQRGRTLEGLAHRISSGGGRVPGQVNDIKAWRAEAILAAFRTGLEYGGKQEQGIDVELAWQRDQDAVAAEEERRRQRAAEETARWASLTSEERDAERKAMEEKAMSNIYPNRHAGTH